MHDANQLLPNSFETCDIFRIFITVKVTLRLKDQFHKKCAYFAPSGHNLVTGREGVGVELMSVSDIVSALFFCNEP